MEQTGQAQTPKPKKSRKGLIVAGVVAWVAIMGIVAADNPKTDSTNSSQTSSTSTQNLPAATDTTAPAATAQTTPTETPKTPVTTPAPAPAATPAPASKSCPSGYYLNVDNNCIQSPTAAPSAPAGATAKCADGTYSFSAHRSGTCSHHGGVAEWL